MPVPGLGEPAAVEVEPAERPSTRRARRAPASSSVRALIASSSRTSLPGAGRDALELVEQVRGQAFADGLAGAQEIGRGTGRLASPSRRRW